jgi:hypothetical protein
MIGHLSLFAAALVAAVAAALSFPTPTTCDGHPAPAGSHRTSIVRVEAVEPARRSTGRILASVAIARRQAR